jgi:hypothetical protein
MQTSETGVTLIPITFSTLKCCVVRDLQKIYNICALILL